MEVGCEHEPDSDLFDRSLDQLCFHVQVQTQLFENVRASALACERSIAMRCHRNTGCRDYESRGGAYVERFRSIPAGPAGIHQLPVYDRRDSTAELPAPL